ncbi:DUF3450 family protein [Coraliomargarita sp. W4R53]
MSAYISVASASPGALEDVRTTIGEWATAEKAISRESLQWQGERVLLDDLLIVADKRVAKFEAIIEEHESFVSTSDAKRLELLDQSEQVAADIQQIEGFLVKMERGLRELKPRLPEPLQEELAPIYQRLPLNAAESTVGLGERMQSVVSLLGKIREFDAKISLSESIRELPGSDVEVSFRTVWIGLGQAYYLAPNDAGYGMLGADGWEWHSQLELAAGIRECIALVEGRSTEPKLIELPVALKKGALK